MVTKLRKELIPVSFITSLKNYFRERGWEVLSYHVMIVAKRAKSYAIEARVVAERE